MTTPKANLITGKDGKPLGVFVEIAEYEAMLAGLEELEAIHAYDAAKAAGDEAVPFADAVREIEAQR